MLAVFVSAHKQYMKISLRGMFSRWNRIFMFKDVYISEITLNELMLS
jgi:hypothetical protein